MSDARRTLEELGVDANAVSQLANEAVAQQQLAINAIQGLRAEMGADRFERLAPSIAQNLMSVPGLSEMSTAGRPDLALRFAAQLSSNTPGQPMAQSSQPQPTPWHMPQGSGHQAMVDGRQADKISRDAWAAERLHNVLAAQGYTGKDPYPGNGSRGW